MSNIHDFFGDILEPVWVKPSKIYQSLQLVHFELKQLCANKNLAALYAILNYSKDLV